MKDKEKTILWLVYAVLIVIAVIVGYLLIDVNVRVGIIQQ